MNVAQVFCKNPKGKWEQTALLAKTFVEEQIVLSNGSELRMKYLRVKYLGKEIKIKEGTGRLQYYQKVHDFMTTMERKAKLAAL